MSRYGKKGGEGPTRGKKASTYRFTFPDGTTGTKRSFHCHDPVEAAFVYRHEGVWYAASIGERYPGEMGHSHAVEARRVG